MTPGRLIFIAVLVALVWWAPEWMRQSGPRQTPESSPLLASVQELQLASDGSATKKEQALQRVLRDADEHRGSLSAEQRALIDDLRSARGDIRKERVLNNLAQTMEQQKRQTLSFYAWAADVWRSAHEHYLRIQPQAQPWLWALAIAVVALGLGAAMWSHMHLARRWAKLGFGVSRGWLVILSLVAIVLVLATRTNPWASFPPELVLPPLLALVGCAFALRLVDFNYPVWNSLVRGCGAPLISMAFSAVFLNLV